MELHIAILWIVGIVVNIGVVAEIRARAEQAGKRFLQSGRFAIIGIFSLSLVWQFFLGGCEGLASQEAIVKLVEDAWIMAGACLGTHASWKTLIDGRSLK